MDHMGGPNKGSRILVIDDDPEIVKLLTIILQAQGFVVHQAFDGKDGLKSAYEFHPSLVILDVMMPGMDGWELCTRLRELSSVPILMLTARAAETDMLRGFQLGADDYLRKPFSKAELEARVRALLRRHENHSHSNEIRQYKDRILNIDLETQTVELEGEMINLSATEFTLLSCLVRHVGVIVTHRQLLREVWGSDDGTMSPTLSLYIHNLRKKMKHSELSHEYLHTHWGRGYCFVPLNEN
jgi:DNA-binding response OmpR family regulator